MLKKAKLYSLLAIIVASTVVGLVSFPQTAGAQAAGGTPEGYDAQEIIDSVKTHGFAEFMSYCLDGVTGDGKGSDGWEIKRSQVENGNWFDHLNDTKDNITPDFAKKAKSVGIEITGSGDDGKLSCKDDNLKVGSEFTKTMGWTTGHDALCSLGFKVTLEESEDAISCDDVQGRRIKTYGWTDSDNKSANYFLEKIKSSAPNRHAFTGGDTYKSAAQYHLIQKRAYRYACGNEPTSSTTGGQAVAQLKIVDYDITSKTATDPYEVQYTYNKDWEKNDGRVPLFYDEARSCSVLFNELTGDGGYATSNAIAYKKWLNTAKPGLKGAGNINPDGAATSSCQVDGIGWLICPVINLMANMVDSSYYLLDNSLLRTPPIPLNDNDEPLYKAWKTMRDFANIIFVIVFLIVIFSQITNVGMSNYGIKQILPKLIIAAILVNLSYLICALAVDISNILGSELKDLLSGLAKEVAPNEKEGRYLSRAMSDGGGWSGAVGWIGITGIILAAGGAVGGFYAVLLFLIPVLFAALGAVLATVITLVLRQAFIIILIFISPLAFVAILLPNTEGYFRKWRTAFQSLLLLYPVIAIVFGGSALASTIIMGAAEASHGGGNGDEILGGITQTILQIAGAAISVVPLFIVPTIIKIAGGALNRFAGIVNNPNKGPIDWARNRSIKGAERLQKQQNLNTVRSPARTGKRGRAMDFVSGRSKFRKGVDQEGVDAGVESELSRAKTERKASLMTDSSGNVTDYARKVAGGNDTAAIERVTAGAKFTLEKLELEEVKAAGVTVENMDLPQLNNIMNDVGKDYSAAQKAAALDRIVKIGDPGDYEKYVDSYGSDSSNKNAIVRSTLADSIANNGPGWLKSSDIDNIRNGNMGKDQRDASGKVIGTNASSLADVARNNAKSGVESQAKMANDTKGNIEYLQKHADSAGQQVLAQTAQDLLNNPNLRGQLKHNTDAVKGLASKAPQPVSAPDFQAPRNSINPGTGRITKRPSAVSGADAAQQLHSFSGNNGTMSKKTLREGLGKLSDTDLGRVISHASTMASTDPRYGEILKYSQKEATSRNRKP